MKNLYGIFIDESAMGYVITVVRDDVSASAFVSYKIIEEIGKYTEENVVNTTADNLKDIVKDLHEKAYEKTDRK